MKTAAFFRHTDRTLSFEAGEVVFKEGDVGEEMFGILTAVALTDCQVAVIDRRLFLFLVHETPTFALDVVSTLADRVRTMQSAV